MPTEGVEPSRSIKAAAFETAVSTIPPDGHLGAFINVQASVRATTLAAHVWTDPVTIRNFQPL